jgi:hypothetical protein
MRKTLLLLGFLGFVSAAAQGFAQQIRFLPENGKRGVTGAQKPLPEVVIGRQTLVLAPGGVIFDTHNRTILHQALPRGADVWYQLNGQGQVQRIYILRPEEQARLTAARK